MSKYSIQGGRPLTGEVTVSGAKNAALKMMAAAILTDEVCVLQNVPRIKDVDTMVKVLDHLGVDTEWTAPGELKIQAGGRLTDQAPYELVSQMRASIMVLGPLLARLGRAHVALPGGCNIGSRKIDLHLSGLKSLGTTITTGHGYIEGIAEKLHGTTVTLDFPSVGATENILMGAVLAEGTTVIENAAREPEIVDLIAFLQGMGAQIIGAGTAVVEIEGVGKLHGVTHRTISDRIEAGTFLIGAAITRGSVTVHGAEEEALSLVLEKLKQAGASIIADGQGITLSLDARPAALDVSTLPYPGFPTDLQPLMAVLLSVADGISVVTENVFENRFLYIDELNRMGADIRLDGHHAVIQGVPYLSGAPVKVPDLRAGAALILAGLAADGDTVVEDTCHIDRGYERFEEKLRGLGASIKREKS